MTCTSIRVLAVCFAVYGFIVQPSPVSARTSFPYETTIHCGELSTAILTLGSLGGETGAAACTKGRDAIPAFTTVSAYESYYKVDGGSSCDEDCLKPTFNAMKSAGLMRPLLSGDRVTVLGAFRDPDDHRYTICRVTAKARNFLVLCDALAVQPEGSEGTV